MFHSTTSSAFAKELTFLENGLNQYHSANYRIRFTMVTPEDGLMMEPDLGITLAESATTSRYTISGLEFTQKYSISPAARASFYVTGHITVNDPNGFGFMDSIVDSAARLGVRNGIINCFYLIEIEFVGSLPDGRTQVDTDRAVYAVQIIKSQTRLTEKGGEFKLYFAGSDAAAGKHINIVLPGIKNIKQKDGGHIKDYLVELEKSLNTDEKEKTKGTTPSATYANEWKFILDPKIIKSDHFKFEKTDKASKDDTHTTGTDGKNSTNTVARDGSTVPMLIHDAMANTKAMLYGLNDDGSLSDPLKIKDAKTAKEDAKKIKQMFRVDITVYPTNKWDPITNSYQKQFYYYIFLQNSPDWTYGPIHQLTNADINEVVSSRLKNPAYFNNLKKRYDFYYTGVNSEVIKFDLTADFQLFTANAILTTTANSGTTTGSGRTDPAPKALTTPKPGGQPETSVIGNLMDRGLAALASRRLRPGQLNNNRGISSKDATRAGREGSNFLTYAEENLPKLESMFQGGYPILPEVYSYANNNVVKGGAASYPGEKDLRRQKFEHIYNSLTYTGPDFMKVTITVRGDPYWFGVAKPVFRQGVLINGPGIPGPDRKAQLNRANFFFGQEKFYIEVHSADLADTGRRVSSPTISGIYTIVQCVNKFTNGRFEQELFGIRDLLMHGRAMHQMVSTAKVTDPKIQAQ